MRKTIVILVSILMITLMGACSQRALTEREIFEDVTHLTEFQELGVEMTDCHVVKRQTKTESNEDVVYVSVTGRNSSYTVVRNYRLVYVLYNDGWILEEVNSFEDEQYQDSVKLHSGISASRLEKDIYSFQSSICPDAVLEKSVNDSVLLISDLEQLCEVYQTIVKYEYQFLTELVWVEVEYNFLNLEWIPSFEVKARDVIFKNNIIGTWEAESIYNGGTSVYKTKYSYRLTIDEVKDNAIYGSAEITETVNGEEKMRVYFEPMWLIAKFDSSASGFVLSTLMLKQFLMSPNGLSCDGIELEKVS